MKNTKTNRAKKNSFLAIAVVTAILFCFTACEEDSGGGGGGGGVEVTPDYIGTDIADFATWLADQPDNTPETAYLVKLNVDNLGGNSYTAGSVGKVLRDNSTKYVSLDLSGSTITSIEYQAFWYCTSLVSVTIPNSVESIELHAFYRCASLTGVTIPNSVTSIASYAFYDCTSLTGVTIPNSVTSIGEYAFSYCTSLTSVTFQGTITSANFSSYSTFPGDLRTKYLASGGGIGTYTRAANGSTWTKQ